jgi:hypothetical protein
MGRHLPFPFSPSSTSRRIASERPILLALAHASTSATIASGMRAVTCGSRPVAGRPRRFFGVTLIDRAIITV